MSLSSPASFAPSRFKPGLDALEILSYRLLSNLYSDRRQSSDLETGFTAFAVIKIQKGDRQVGDKRRKRHQGL